MHSLVYIEMYHPLLWIRIEQSCEPVLSRLPACAAHRSQHSPLVFQCVLVQDEFRWCKSFLLFLGHIGKELSFNGLSMGHDTRFLLQRHRKERKESVNLCKASAFLPFQTLHKLIDCAFHACSIWSIKKLINIRAPLRVPSGSTSGSTPSWALEGSGIIASRCAPRNPAHIRCYILVYDWCVKVYLSLYWVELSIS